MQNSSVYTKTLYSTIFGLQGELNLANLLGKKWVYKNHTQIQNQARGLRIINGQLWCCHEDGITIFNEQLEKELPIKKGEMGECHDVAQHKDNGDTIIAAQYGLYLLADTGKLLQRSFH